MTGDRLIRYTTALAVLAVATIAAVISYGHIETLALSNGQPLVAARLLPASVDGAVLAASLVLLDAARRGVPAPALARVMLVLGVLATLGANAAIGAAHGAVGIMVSAWPAVAFIGTAEVVLGMARVRSQGIPETVPGTVPAGVLGTAFAGVPEAAHACVPGTTSKDHPGASKALPPRASRRRGVHAPEAVFAAELEAGELPSIRTVKRRMKVGQDKAKTFRDQLAALVQTRMSEPAETIEVTA